MTRRDKVRLPLKPHIHKARDSLRDIWVVTHNEARPEWCREAHLAVDDLNEIGRIRTPWERLRLAEHRRRVITAHTSGNRNHAVCVGHAEPTPPRGRSKHLGSTPPPGATLRRWLTVLGAGILAAVAILVWLGFILAEQSRG